MADGDILIPYELILPEGSGATIVRSKRGEIWLSGGKICFYDGTGTQVITSA